MKGDRVFTPSTDELRRLLRAGDPFSDDRVPSAEQIAAARRAVLAAAAPRSRPVVRHLRPVVLSGLATLLALTVGLSVWRDLSPPPPPPTASAPSLPSEAVDQDASLDVRGPGGTRLLFFNEPPAADHDQESFEDRRLLHFQTPGGTRILWTLNRNFPG